MATRRSFIKRATAGTLAAGIAPQFLFGNELFKLPQGSANGTVIVSTWSHGLDANEVAWETLLQGGSVLDAVEQGVMVSEADPNVSSVGYGGFPDAEGNVTLDACIMSPDGNAGSVTYLQHILHPVSVARLVMEKTPHVILSGEGALKFALDHGFEKTKLLTDAMKKNWEDWKASGARYAPAANWENHDTIGLLAMDAQGDMAGACTTSGMAFKHPGRVGDSPIIGAGLFVDNEVGAATATGEGEVILKTLGSFLIVELMRQGMNPQQACEEAIHRITKKTKVHPNLQIGYIALSKAGELGAFSLRPGFQYALRNKEGQDLINSAYLIEW